MLLRHASLALLLFLFALSLITFITSVKYALWAASSIKAAGSAVPIIFYSGTLPILSLLQTTLQIACLHSSAFIPPPYFLILAATGLIAWIAQASVWTICELSGGLPAPGKIVTTPRWCPQMDFNNHGGNLSAPLTVLKITLAWAMMAVYVAMLAVDLLSMRRASQGERVDEFHELLEIQASTPRRRKQRPYSSAIQVPQAPQEPAIQILPISNRAWI